MSKKNDDVKHKNIRKILKNQMYIKESYSLEKLLRLRTPKSSYLKMYIKNENYKYIPNPKKEKNKNKLNESLNKIKQKKDIIKLNQSVIKLFNKTNYLHKKAKELYEENKDFNDIFYKKFKTMRKLEKEKIDRALLKRNYSANINIENIGIFDNNLINKYKQKLGKEFINEFRMDKDIYQVTPIVSKNSDDMKFFYIYNYDKYVEKTNRNYPVILSGKLKNIISNDDKIKYDNLIITQFYKKLYSIAQKNIYKLQNKNSQKFNFDYKYLGNKDIKISQEIPKLKKDIKTINSLFGIMKNRRTTSTKKLNIFEDYKTPNNTGRNFFKKIIIKKQDESSNNTTNRIYSTKRSIKKETETETEKINITNNKIKPLSPFPKKIMEKNERKINKKSLLDNLTFSKTQKDKFFNLNQYKEEKSIMSTKTKTTFYNSKYNKEENNILLSPKNHLRKSFSDINKDIKESSTAYEELKSMSTINQESILNNIENYLTNNGYNVNRIKNAIKKTDIYNFFDGLKNVVDNYQCKQKMNNLYTMIGKKIPDNLKINLNDITQLDKDIYKSGNNYYISLLKNIIYSK